MSSQIQITGETKVKSLTGVLVGTSGVVSSLNIDGSLGIPQLDVNGKILVSQLPNSVMEYKGTWDASTNTPTLVNGTGNQGDVYLCSVAGTVNFGAGAISFVVSDQVIYSGSIWQKASGSNGTVTSVAITESGDSLNITGSPITTSGTINIGFNGTNLQYVNGAGNLTTFPTLISSIGLSMPSAFSVANSPLTANGTIAVTGAGYPSQYIRGDGTLADFPTSGGGGSSVSYYLNGGTSQGTIGGVTYYEMSKTADTGTGVDFNKTGDGFIVAFLTDAGDPAQLNIPAGNWNYEIYASMSANGGTPEMYAELYKYDGTTFTLIATSPHEILYDGTALNLYTFAMTVPSTTLALTDRLAIKLYATNSGGKTTTVHTQDSYLCQVITTFSTGITALNGLTAQVQYFATGTSGTDFNISSATATHTFNIPDASASARGLITTGTQTIAGVKTFSNGLILQYNYFPTPSTGDIGLGSNSSGITITTKPSTTLYNNTLQFSNGSNSFLFPNATGTLALTSDLGSYLPLTGGTLTGALSGTSATFSSSVSIGTTTTYGKLNIKGASTIPTAQTYNGLFVIESSDGRTSLQMGIQNAAVSGADGTWIQSYNQPATAAGNFALMLNPLGGNVLIGTTTDSGYKLDVSGTGRFNGTSASPLLSLTNTTGGTLADFTITENVGLIINSYEGATARSIDFKVAGTSALLIASTGAATFSSSVSVATFLRASSGAQSNPTGGGSVVIDYQSTSNLQGRIRSRDWDGATWKNLTLEANNIILSPTGNVGIGTSSPTYQLQLSTDSAAKPTSALWTIASDERIKENINPYKKGLQELLKINPITYDYNGLGGFVKGKGGVGIIAQEIIDILPDSVSSIKAKLNETDEDETNILNFNGHELIYVLINSIKEQQAIITSLQDRLDKAGL